MAFDLPSYMEERRKWVDEALDRCLPPPTAYPSPIHEAMRYSVFGGGKRLRPILILAATEAMGCDDRRALPLATAMELIHTYSLVHDDLPAMDDSDYRRGQLSCHKKFGEAIAILTGDALLTLAFSVVSREAFAHSLEDQRLAWIIREIAQAAGIGGMVGGQTADILSQNKEVDASVLLYVHEHKTGALIRACLRLGGIIGKADPSTLETLTDYGEKIGLAFQIGDDILDVEGEEKLVGKELRKDEAEGKITYPRLLGLDYSKRELRRLVEEATQAISSLPESRTQPLRAIAEHIIQRRN